MQIKNRKKTQKVARVLLNSKKSSTFAVKATAYQLGFSEPASFCRFFKRVTGTTPQQFRSDFNNSQTV
ncbi:MAG: helix-turn-helix transcriptional regulator [Paludibacteraceae bacterium]|nr:helix-turn-helix transcriptional regulator [Paludibacteraceae bacterium]MBQ2520264.1 helix-turn-helix transcriptional regulator [Paludibacteraceae bacterium]